MQQTCNTPIENNHRNQRSQRRAENVDTVGVTGSIPVSPNHEGPGFRGLHGVCDSIDPFVSTICQQDERAWGGTIEHMAL